jgi:hypothetical protein
MKTAETWRPLLTGELAKEAWEAVLEIAAALERPGDGSADPTVASGSAGLALFHTYLSQALGDDRWADAAVAWFDHMVEAVPGASLGQGLYSGLLGIGWTIEHLKGRLYASEDEADPEDDGNAEIACLELRRDRLQQAIERAALPPQALGELVDEAGVRLDLPR